MNCLGRGFRGNIWDQGGETPVKPVRSVFRTDDSFSLSLMNVYDAIPLFVDGETEKFDCAGTRIQGVIAVRDSGSVGKDPGIFQIVGNFADKWITKDRIKTIRSISLSANFLIIWDIVKL